MNLRPATLSDQAALFDMHVEVFREHIEEIWGWNDEWQIANFKKEWAEVRTEILTQDGKLLGYIQTRLEADHIYVLNLALHPHCQSLGFGSMAMGILKERARLQELAIKLSVFRTNQRVIAFYRRLGFEVETETETGFRMHWRDNGSSEDKTGEQAATEQPLPAA